MSTGQEKIFFRPLRQPTTLLNRPILPHLTIENRSAVHRQSQRNTRYRPVAVRCFSSTRSRSNGSTAIAEFREPSVPIGFPPWSPFDVGPSTEPRMCEPRLDQADSHASLVTRPRPIGSPLANFSRARRVHSSPRQEPPSVCTKLYTVGPTSAQDAFDASVAGGPERLKQAVKACESPGFDTAGARAGCHVEAVSSLIGLGGGRFSAPVPLAPRSPARRIP